jgi:uncharacterized protein (TIGR04255 family)
MNLRLGSERPIAFQENLSTAFPKASEGITLEAEVPGADPQKATLKQPVLSWEFYSRDEASRVMLQRDFLSLETKKYAHYEEFRRLFEVPYLLLRQIYSVPVIVRLGLRYQNHLTLPSGVVPDWLGYLQESLIAHLGFAHGGKLVQDAHTLKFDIDETHVNLNYGLHNPDYPGPVNKRTFRLDIDCYLRDDIEPDAVLEKLGELNKEATDVFERSVGEAWRASMRSST